MWDLFIEYRLYPTYIFELFAAVAGIFYLFSNKNAGRADRLLVLCLIFIFVMDLGTITFRLYSDVYDYKYIEFLKDSPFGEFFWMYNSLNLVANSLFTFYYMLQLRSRKLKNILKGFIFSYWIGTIVLGILTGEYFKGLSSFVYIFGAFLICTSIAFYYLELIRTERILNFKRELPLFISVGLLIFQLAATPIFIFQRYIEVSEEFSEVYGWTLDAANFFMYTVFTIGFITMIFQIKRTRVNVLN